MAAVTTNSETVYIMTWTWSEDTFIHKIDRNIANSLRVFREAEVKNHLSKSGEIPVLEFKGITSAAMSIFLSFLKGGNFMDQLEDSYFEAAFPDLLVFIAKHITTEEFFMRSMQELHEPLVEKMFLSLTHPEDTDVEKMKAALVKCEIPVPEKYKEYF